MEAKFVVLDENHADGASGCLTLRCENCGVRVSVRLPIATEEVQAMTVDFGRRHQFCSLVMPKKESQ